MTRTITVVHQEKKASLFSVGVALVLSPQSLMASVATQVCMVLVGVCASRWKIHSERTWSALARPNGILGC